MSRLISVAVAAIAVLGIAGTAVGKGPVGECPNSHSGFFAVDQQQWWDNTVQGFVDEGIDVYVSGDPNQGYTPEFEALAVELGFASAADLHDYVWITQWQAIDKNGDLVVCMKDWPNTPGLPAYLWGGVDNTAH